MHDLYYTELNIVHPAVNNQIDTETETPRENVIKLYTMLIYCHSMVLLSFYYIKQYYHGNCHRKVENYLGKKFY